MPPIGPLEQTATPDSPVVNDVPPDFSPQLGGDANSSQPLENFAASDVDGDSLYTQADYAAVNLSADPLQRAREIGAAIAARSERIVFFGEGHSVPPVAEYSFALQAAVANGNTVAAGIELPSSPAIMAVALWLGGYPRPEGFSGQFSEVLDSLYATDRSNAEQMQIRLSSGLRNAWKTDFPQSVETFALNNGYGRTEDGIQAASDAIGLYLSNVSNRMYLAHLAGAVAIPIDAPIDTLAWTGGYFVDAQGQNAFRPLQKGAVAPQVNDQGVSGYYITSPTVNGGEFIQDTDYFNPNAEYYYVTMPDGDRLLVSRDQYMRVTASAIVDQYGFDKAYLAVGSIHAAQNAVGFRGSYSEQDLSNQGVIPGLFVAGELLDSRSDSDVLSLAFDVWNAERTGSYVLPGTILDNENDAVFEGVTYQNSFEYIIPIASEVRPMGGGPLSYQQIQDALAD